MNVRSTNSEATKELLLFLSRVKRSIWPSFLLLLVVVVVVVVVVVDVCFLQVVR